MGTGRIHKNRSAQLGGDSSHLDKHLWFIELVIQAGVFFSVWKGGDGWKGGLPQ